MPTKTEQLIAELDALTAEECAELADLLADDATRREMRAGVYVLYRDGRVIYVGQTTNLVERLGRHVREKQFDAYLFFPCERWLIEDLERVFIRARPAAQHDAQDMASNLSRFDDFVAVEWSRAKAEAGLRDEDLNTRDREMFEFALAWLIAREGRPE